MNLQCRRFVYEETERGRLLEEIEVLKVERGCARAYLQEIYDWYDTKSLNMELLAILVEEIGTFLDD